MLTGLLQQAVQNDPDKTAILQGERRVSYAELEQMSACASTGLNQLGIGAGDCVAVILPNCPEFVVSLLACARLHAIMLPLNPHYTQEELQRFILDGQTKVIITDAKHLDVCRQLLADTGADIKLVLLDGQAEDATSFSHLINQASWPMPEEQFRGRSLYLYTSGSTSAYKRLCCTQENLYYEAHNFVETLGLTADDTILCTVPLYHSYGFGNGLLDALYCGSTLVLLEPVIENGEVVDVPFISRTERVLELIKQENIRFFPGVPYQFAALAELPLDVDADLSGIKWCVSSGDVLPRQTYERFLQRFGLAIRSLYGSTEAGSICINTDATELMEFGSLGLPLANVEIQIRDDQGNELPQDASGAIWVKSPVIPPSGYDNRPELSEEVFRDGYYDTGDMGKKDPRDHLVITGRKQTFVDVGGYKVDIGELEEVLQAHPNVREATALGIDMPQAGQIIKAVIVGDCSENELIAWCRERLASYKLPRVIEFRDELPRSTLGKILKKELRETPSVTDGVALLSEALQSASNKTQRLKIIAEHIQQQVAATLQIEPDQVSPNASFQSMGFNSILSAELQNRLIHLTGTALPITLLWNHPSIEQMAVVIDGKLGTTATQVAVDATETSGDIAIHEPIAIIGIGCRFPGGAKNADEFWEFLLNGGDGVTEIPADRWDVDDYYDANPDAPGKSYSRWGGFLDNVSDFDPAFFNISPREAQQMDPRQRLLLETAWEALEQAACAPETLSGSRTGVFVGHMVGDYHGLLGDNLNLVDSYVSTGVLDSLLANRLSYTLNLQGPSLSVDTACSSALTALYLACQNLRQNACDTALVGGINLMLSPEMHIIGAKAGILSPTGHCSTFSSDADGFVRGEGCGMLVLKRLSDAQRDNDSIMAVVRGVATNQDGLTNGIAAPNGFSQQRVIQQALQNAQVDAADVTLVEAHGTGTLVGDPIEVEALSAIYGAPSEQGDCYLGAVKANIGHLEGAAGISGLIKMVMCLHKQAIPPNIHFRELNPHINLDLTRFKLPLEAQAWPSKGMRFGAVSSFGIGGTNGHVILQQAPEMLETAQSIDRPQHILTLSARSPDALINQAKQYQSWLRANANTHLADMAYTANIGRNHFEYRQTIVADSSENLLEQLATLQTPKQSHTDLPESKIAFLFTGQGSQFVGMGRELYATQPYFKQTLDACAAILADELDHPLLDIMHGESDLIDQTAYTQPTLFALEYALAKLWQSWGVQPDWLIGHSVGEYAAACVAGVFSLQDGLKLIATRGRLMQALPQNGGMVAVRADEATVSELIQSTDSDQVTIAALNGPNSLVVSGENAQLASLVEACKQQDIQTKALVVSHAFHSPLMEPMLDEFRQVAASVTFHKPQIGLISNLTGQPVTDEITQVDYWVNHVRQAVRFADGMTALQAEGANVFIEVGPKPTLMAMARQFMRIKDSVWLPSLKSPKSDWQQILTSLGEAYQRGVSVNWLDFDQDYPRRKLALPTYPFERQSYWMAASTNSRRASGALRPLVHKMTRSPRLQETVLEAEFNLDGLPFLRDHQVYNEVVVPGATYLATLLSGADVLGRQRCQMQDVLFPAAMVLDEGESRISQVVLTPNAKDENQAKFELISFADLNSEAQTHMMGNLNWQQPESNNIQLSDLQARCNEIVDPERLYQVSLEQQIDFGPSFRWMQRLFKNADGKETLAHLVLPSHLDTKGYAFHPALLDSCFQVAASTLLDANEEETWLPFLIRNVRAYQTNAAASCWCHAVEKGQHIWDIHLFDADGNLLLEFEGFEERVVPSEALLGKPVWHDWLYQVAWQPVETATQELAKSWLVFADKTGVAQSLTDKLVEKGCEVQLVHLDQFKAASAEDYAKLIQSQIEGFAVLHLSSLDIANETGQVEWLNVQTLYLLQALTASPVKPAGLWLATQNAQQVLAADEVTHPAQAALWGMHKTLLLEQADLYSMMLDLPADMHGESMDLLLADLSADTSQTPRETNLAYREGKRYAARLTRHPAAEVDALTLQAEATYLITGGTGGLGLSIASWMVEQGAGYLVLLARSEPSASAQEKIHAMREAGADVQVVAVDIADLASLQAATANLAKPIKGIIHAAGVIDDSTIQQQNAERFQRVMQPKVQGAWNLHQLSQQMPLDFFVTFSSLTGLLGTIGQINYGAANAYMDALAKHRHSQGLPALSINWGGWAEVGMAAQMDEAELNRLAARGESLISPTQGLEILATLLQQSPAQVAALPINWAKYLPATGSHNDAFFEQWLVSANSLGQSENVQTGWVQTLQDAPEQEQYELLLENLRIMLAQILGLPSAEKVGLRQGLRDLGLDSILSIEVRGRLEVELDISLPATLLFDYPTVETLAEYLGKNYLNIAAPKAEEDNQAAMLLDDDLSDLLADIDQISDEDIQQQLGGK